VPTAAQGAPPRQNDAPGWTQERATATNYEHRVIQRRKFNLEHELFLAAEALPSDALYKGFCAHVAYARHFGDVWAWEVMGLSYCESVDTDLKNQLLPIAASVNQTLPVLPEVTGVASTRLQLKPFYGKQAWRDKGLLHGEVFIQAGPALVITRIHNAKTTAAPGIDFGLGLRVWLDNKFSLRADVGEVAVFVAGQTAQALRVDFGMSIELGSGP
jgi:hypothetical protein